MKITGYDADGRRKYLNKKENKEFRAAAEALPLERAAFCLTIYFTGCRISEALDIRGNDVEWDCDVITFRCLKKRGKKVNRRLPIPAFITKQLRTIVELENEKIWNFSRTTAWRIVKKTMANAGISGVHATAKGLRHSFGVRGVIKRVPVHLLCNWMGHSHSSTTAIYLDVKGDEELEMIQRTWED